MSVHQAEGKRTNHNPKEEEKFSLIPAPHKRIPAEILAEVFVMAAGNEVVVFPPDFSSTPWVLSRVCRRWRNVALGDWRLWRQIRFHRTDNHQAQRLIAFANRIVPSGVQLSISDDGMSSILDELVMEQLVVPRLPRLKVFRPSLGPRAYRSFFAASAETLASIVELDISWSSLEYLDTHSANDMLIFSKVQKLQSLKITHGFPNMTKPSFVVQRLLGMSIPWHQLRAVRLESVPYKLYAEQMWFILRQCPVLQEFSACMEDSEPEGDIGDAIVLPHLRTLALQFWGLELRPLILPALKKLHLDARPSKFTDIETLHMLSRSQCTLDQFELTGIHPWPSDVSLTSELLSHLSTVRKFIAGKLWLEQPMLEMIGRGELLPSASHFCCGVCSVKEFVDALEMRLVEAKEAGSIVTAIKVAHGHHRYFGRGEAEGLRRLGALNEQYGTQYSLHEISYLDHASLYTLQAEDHFD